MDIDLSAFKNKINEKEIADGWKIMVFDVSNVLSADQADQKFKEN